MELFVSGRPTKYRNIEKVHESEVPGIPGIPGRLASLHVKIISNAVAPAKVATKIPRYRTMGWGRVP